MITEQEYAEWKRIQQRFPTSIVGRLVDERDALRSALARLCEAVEAERAAEWVDVRTEPFRLYIAATDAALAAALSGLRGE